MGASAAISPCPPPWQRPTDVFPPPGRAECSNGFGYHSSQAHLDTDQRRHNGLLLGRWRVLRLGWWRFETDWAGFCAELSALFGQTAATSRP